MSTLAHISIEIFIIKDNIYVRKTHTMAKNNLINTYIRIYSIVVSASENVANLKAQIWWLCYYIFNIW